MNHINKKAISSLGYGFIPKEFIPKGKNEYHLRNIQNRSGIRYRKLTAAEIKVLEKNDNSSDNWSKVLVSDSFDPKLVKRCCATCRKVARHPDDRLGFGHRIVRIRQKEHRRRPAMDLAEGDRQAGDRVQQ